MTKQKKIFYFLIISTTIFTLIIFGLLGGVLNNNYYFSDSVRWMHCRNAMFAFVALDGLSILGLILFPVFAESDLKKVKNKVNHKENKNNITNLNELKEPKDLGIINENLIKEINELKENINFLKFNQKQILPVGTILISTVSPIVGKWTDLGELKNGQALLGGDSSNGELISLNNNELKTDKNIIPFPNVINIRTNNNLNYHLKTKNITYGLGIGKGFHIWRRDA